MPRRGAVTVTQNPAGVDDGTNQPWTTAKWNANGAPTAQVAEGAIGEDELNQDAVQNVAGALLAGKAIVSPDYVQGRFYDGVLTVGSTSFTSALMALSNADSGRGIVATGIPGGTTIAYSNPTTGVLSQAAQQIFSDGVISGTTNLYSPTANFSVADNGRTVIDTSGAGLIPAGTTLTYVDAHNATLSQAGTNGAVSFQVNGRQLTAITFQIVGRGAGWKVGVNGSGAATFEDYTGFFGGLLAVVNTAILSDGTIVCGVGANKLVISPTGDALWATGLGITKDGKLFSGAGNYTDAVSKLDAAGNFVLQALAASTHSVPTDAVDPTVQNVVASPSGGAIVNPTNVSLNCLTKHSRIYYRSVAKDGVTNTDSSFVSATGNFTVKDVGKELVGTGVPAGAFVKSVTNSTTIVLSANTTATATSVEWYLTPDRTDTLYTDGTPITLTTTRKIAARAFKNGEYSAVGVWLFTVDATTVSNPIFSPIGGSFGGTTLAVTLSDTLAGASIRYNTSFSTSTTVAPADPADPTSAAGTLISPANGATPPTGAVNMAKGTTVIKAIAYKGGSTDSQVVKQTYVVTGGGTSGEGGHLGGGGGGSGIP